MYTDYIVTSLQARISFNIGVGDIFNNIVKNFQI